ncbi:sialin-like isoform X1 [Diadema setosum]|uniref:sialin-like isoform X1 n=1 Tax=Diadema setosum TaxID=31175 RepID=UPI003B3B654C
MEDIKRTVDIEVPNYRDETPSRKGKFGKLLALKVMFSTRYIIAYLAFCVFACGYMSRVTMSIAMTAMVNDSALNVELHHWDSNASSQLCSAYNSSSSPVKQQDGPFSWTIETQELILASFFYGFLILQVPVGYLANKYSRASVWFFGLSLGVTGVCNVLVPVAAHAGVTWLCIDQVISGLVEGCRYPVYYAIMARWAPPEERSRLISIGLSGIPFGQIIGLPIAGLWASSEEAGGWPSAFYFTGTLCIMWCIGWLSLVYDSPSSHPRISDTERDYITKSVGLEQTQPSVTPWRSIMTSVPLLAVCIGDFAVLWILYLFATNLPIYLNDVLQFDIYQTGFISALPFLLYWLIMILGGYIADFIISRSILNRTGARKLLTVLGFVPSTICLVSAGYVGCDVTLGVALLTLGLGTSAFCLCGTSICGFDIAPKYAGFLSAIINCFAGTTGFLVPLLIGALTTKEGNVHGWRLVFWTTAGVSMFGLIVFSIFGTAQVQSWAQEPEASEQNGNDRSSGETKQA